MTMSYVRNRYGVPVGMHSLVRPLEGRFAGESLIVTRCTNHVHARHPFSQEVLRYHPIDLEYKTDNGWVKGEDCLRGHD